MPRQSEPSANNALRDLLQPMLSRSEVRSENTQFISGHPGLRPDIIVSAPGRSPVVLEAEYLPAATAEKEAIERLGMEVSTVGRPIEAAIALRYSLKVRDADDLHAALRSERLSYCIFTGLPDDHERFPSSGWLEGDVGDLADLLRLVSQPQQAVDAAATVLQEGIEVAAKHLDGNDTTHIGITQAVADVLGLENVPQTLRMACAIIANAMVFHERMAGMYSNVKPLSQICGDSVADPKSETIAAWTLILDIDYWPIFSVAKDLVEQLPSRAAAETLRRLRVTAQSVDATGVDNAHDLTGRIFQRLIADRKYLATFYTLPASAALLARLAVAKMDSVDWSDPEAIGNLRVGDFACGTGALLSAVYEQFAARHERAGGNPAALHKAMMEEVLYGCDVMPSAIHITGSTLSGIETSVGFGSSRLYVMPYGRQTDGAVKIGSLDLLQSSTGLTLFNTSDPALRTGSVGQETASQVLVDIPHEGFDLVIMNPPFTRPGSDWEGRERTQDYVKQFRGLSTGLVTQKDMASSLSGLAKDTCYHGYAGIASAFTALADKKLKPGGVLALVLPMTVASGASWEAFREMLAKQYTGLTVITLAAADNDDLSFSSDTGLAECLVIARRLKPDEVPARVDHFASLRHRPPGFVQSSSVAGRLLEDGHVRGIEDGPYGGRPLMVGEELVGEAITAPHIADGKGWGAVRLSDYSLAQTAYALSDSKLWLPGMASPLELKTTTISELGTRGWHDINLAGSAGPFTKAASSPTATYPSLWSHDAKQETRMVCLPDSQLLVKSGMEERAATAWATASRAHISRGFRFNSQPLAVAFTEQRSIGGRAWPNVKFNDPLHDFTFAIWGNSTLGMMFYWWHANRQVAGRGDTTISSIDSLPTLDFRTLTDAQLTKAEEIFEEFRDKELQPAYLADADSNRALLDRRVVCDLLGFDQMVYEGVRRLAAKWCAEPSVHGGKARPKGAKPVS